MLRSWVAAASFSHVLTSPRLRARATCELSGASSKPEVEPDLAEWDYGDYEGLRSADICDGRPGWNLFRDGCPNGESPAQVCRRADRLIAHVRTMEGDVALFSHGQFGAVLAARWIGLEVVEGQHFSIGPASLSLLSYDIDHPTVPVIGLWNAAPGCGAPVSSRQFRAAGSGVSPSNEYIPILACANPWLLNEGQPWSQEAFMKWDRIEASWKQLKEKFGFWPFRLSDRWQREF